VFGNPFDFEVDLNEAKNRIKACLRLGATETLGRMMKGKVEGNGYEAPSTLQMLISNVGLPSQPKRGPTASKIRREDVQRHDDVTDLLSKTDALMTQSEWQSARFGAWYECFKSYSRQHDGESFVVLQVIERALAASRRPS